MKNLSMKEYRLCATFKDGEGNTSDPSLIVNFKKY